ncbi:putative E3 ubiquitin-protein ligase lin-1 [Phtheirospermum japonicum]|uniref:Putative E3 ubiquitin-protein ligase lin-1 n=1 Tax=Phtheirospermum japonicum TaxID=374723 RepID=A0A830D815_9LAMI|nr:putative E3 ubiquitin-protein ligase lin-1 [Phtheirospermum japonicum]
MTKSLSCRPNFLETHDENTIGVLEKLISNLCFAQEPENGDEDYTLEMKTIYEILNSKPGLKYSLLKDVILDQLLIAISTSKQDRVVRSSVSILSTIVTENRSAIDEIKKRGLQLYDLATALKRNVHEAVILIYLIKPSPAEIKTLELLPCLVEVVCASRSNYRVEVLLTPPLASLMMIEVLVTAFDCETNSMHLAAISSPRVISGLVKVPRRDNLDEFVSLASVLVKCMRFDGKCRKYVSEFSPVDPFVKLLWSNEKRATSIGLEFFNELLRMPRSSATGLLEQMKKQGSMNNMCALFLLMQNSEEEYKLLAANLLLQLEVLEDTSSKRVYGEEATEALLESLTREDCPATQALSAFILSNLGGTYSWTGEPYTMAWLVKKTGLTLAHHKNLIKNYDFLDQSLTDGGIDSWCSKVAQRILRLGSPVFHALNDGLTSKLKRVSRDCLIATAWLGCELVKGPDELRHAACEILLETIEQYMHPGLELEERLLACLCIYNYTSGKGMKKLINLSEGVRESLRRLSNVTWMAEELLKVADYYQPNKWRISCVHSQILEAGNKNNGAVTALIYYKGQLYSGYADGSIKVWDIKGQTATLVQEIKEHKKAVTCFALYEPGNCLLSGSSDKTIKMWQMLQRNLECIEVIPTKESIRSVDSCGELIFATTQSHKLKVALINNKGCNYKNTPEVWPNYKKLQFYFKITNTLMQELMVVNNRQQEIKAPLKSWMQNKPISSVAVYKDWLYCASLIVEGSKMKDWKKSNKLQISIVPEKGASILSMEVVEDFIYLNCGTSTSSLQIWLRGTQQKVGRLSAGSKITSILSANDMILCGTEKGLIKVC